MFFCLYLYSISANEIIIRKEDFKTNQNFINIPDYAQLTSYQGKDCLKVQWTDVNNKWSPHFAKYNLPLENFKGSTIKF